MLIEISGEITPERMKRRTQRENTHTHTHTHPAVMEARSDAVKSNIA